MKRERHGQSFAVLLINIQESPDVVARWVKSKGITSTVLLDRNGDVTRAFGVTGTPTVFLIGRDGGLVARGLGPRPWGGPDGRELLDALIAAPAR